MMDKNLEHRIELFWKGALDLEEQKQLLTDLEKQDLELYNSLKSAFDKKNNNHSDEDYKLILQKIHQKTGIQQNHKTIIPLFKKWLVAASILLVAAFAYYIYFQNNSNHKLLEDQLTKNDSTLLINEKTVNQIAILPDHSKITLFPKSSIRYAVDYGKKDRKIDVVGKAKFEVAHDSLRPFIVFAHGYSTTALGTIFIVESFESDRVSVDLLSGKVRVNQVHETANGMKPQILNPGDKLKIEGEKYEFIQKPQVNIKKPLKTINPAIETSSEKPLLKFDNQDLNQVFEIIAKEKNIKIEFDKELLTGKTFTGEFSESNSLEMILNIICQMNELSFHDNGGTIYINKNDNTQN